MTCAGILVDLWPNRIPAIPSNRFVAYMQQSLAHGQEKGQEDGQCVFIGFSDVLSSFLAPILPTDEATRAVAHPENKG